MSTPEAASEEFRVGSAAEIAAYLQQLQRDQTPVVLHGPPGRSLGCRVSTVDTGADVLGLEIGNDPDGISQALVAEGDIVAVAYHGAVKLQFDLDTAVLVSGAQGAVLRTSLPQQLYRFQRRQAFRVQPAGNLYPRVVLPVDAGADPDSQPLAGRTLRVLDISIGGLALALPAGLGLPPSLQLGHVSPGVTLELDRLSALAVHLLPHHASPLPGSGSLASGVVQLGCAFVDLSASGTRALQMYVDQTQKRRRLLKLDA